MNKNKLIKDFPYEYFKGEVLTDQTAKTNRLKLFRFLFSFLLFVPLVPHSVEAMPLPGADAFGNLNLPKCRNYGTNSRASTSLSKSDSPNINNQDNKMTITDYNSEFDVLFNNRQLQSKFKHAESFGVVGNFNTNNLKLFKEKTLNHMKNPSTKQIQGTWKGNDVDHYFNSDNSLNVIFDAETKNFISCWKFDEKQIKNIEDRGSL